MRKFIEEDFIGRLVIMTKIAIGGFILVALMPLLRMWVSLSTSQLIFEGVCYVVGFLYLGYALGNGFIFLLIKIFRRKQNG